MTDAATASRSLLLDLDRVEWSTEAAELFGLDVSGLPTIVDNASILGHTECFGGSVPVAGACVDQQAALFAESCWSAGEAKCTYGTGAFLLATTGADPVRSVARSGGLRGVATGRSPDLVPRRAGLHRRRRRSPGWRASASSTVRATSIGSAARSPTRRASPSSPAWPAWVPRSGRRRRAARSPGCHSGPSGPTWCGRPSRASPRRWRGWPGPPARTSGGRSSASASTVV